MKCFSGTRRLTCCIKNCTYYLKPRTVEQFKLQSDLLALEAQIVLEMAGDFPLEADIDAHLTLSEQIDESIKLNLSGTLESLDLLLSLKGDMVAKMIGYAHLTEDNTPFELKSLS